VRLRLLRPGASPSAAAAAGPISSRGLAPLGDSWQEAQLAPEALAALPSLLLELLPDASKAGAAAQLPGGAGTLSLRRLPPGSAPGAPVLLLGYEPGAGAGAWSAGLVPEHVQHLLDVLDDVAAQCPGLLQAQAQVGSGGAAPCP
jgi:hypothetical protein